MSGLKVVVVGLDGTPWKFLKPLIDRDELPFLKKIISKSAIAVLKTEIPPYTWCGWKCYSTGTHPGKFKAFYWFRLRELMRGRFIPNDSRSYKSPEIWDYLSSAGYKCLVVNMPMTYPPKKINGIMISGIPALEIHEFVYPRYLKEVLLSKYNYEIVSKKNFNFTSPNHWYEVINKLMEIMRSRFKVVKDILSQQDMDFIHVTIFCTDTTLHWLWTRKDYEHLLLKFWKALDRELERFVDFLYKKFDQNFILFIISDHGMTPLKCIFYINNWLLEKGYLKLKFSRLVLLYILVRCHKLIEIFKRVGMKILRVLKFRLPERLILNIFFRLPAGKPVSYTHLTLPTTERV